MIKDKHINIIAFLIGFVMIFIMKTSVELLFPADVPYVGQVQFYLFNLLIALLITLIVDNGTSRLNTVLDYKFPWFDKVTKRVLIQFLITAVFAFLTLSLISYLIVFILFTFTNKAVVFDRYITLGTIWSIFLSTIYTGVYFFKQWGLSRLEAEQLKQENLKSQNIVLKQQLSPHFLFNSLSTLSGLIVEDQECANMFVQKLSEVYRYVLQSIDKTIVNLSTELKAVEAYLYLHKMRLGNNLIINIHISEKSKNSLIAPLTLQILIENAIKHNAASSNEPLVIDIISQDCKSIIVKNNIRKKKSIEASDHVGLKNIVARYSYLSDKLVKIEETTSEFIVTVPLVEEITI